MRVMGVIKMKSTIAEYLVRLKKNKQKKRRFYAVVMLLSVVVAVGIEWTMRLDGHTLSEDSFCGMEEHRHTDDCWEEKLVCDYEESQGHIHSVEQGCYEEQKLLNCTEEHEHTDECYTVEQVLICTQEECKGHQHNDECREPVRICGKEEHIHNVLCYADVNADVETASDWEKTLPETLSGIWADNLIAVAESQIGYAESERNYTVDSEENRKGYTRYGQWYDSCYDDWDAMFVSWCLYYAEIDESTVPYGTDCHTMITRMKEKNLYRASAGYTPLPGDIVFLDRNGDGAADRTGIVEIVTDNAIKTIEGDSNDCVRQEEHGLADSAILGYCSLPQNPEMTMEEQDKKEPAEETEPEEIIPGETNPMEQGYPFSWESSGYDYVYQGNYKNSNYRVSKNGENDPLTVGTKVLVPGNAVQPWSPDGVPWVQGCSNYQIAYVADMEDDPAVATGYRAESLKDTEYFTQSQKDSLIRIIMHSYPFISAEKMMSDMGSSGVDTSGIGIAEMMSGTQQAIWKITKGIDCMDCGDVTSCKKTEATQISPLQPSEMGEVNGSRAQKAAQKVKEYLLKLPEEEEVSVLEIQEISSIEVNEDEKGEKVLSFQIILNRPVSEKDKNLELTVYRGKQEHKLNVQPGNQKIKVQLDGVNPEDKVVAKLTGETEDLWEFNYFIGSREDGKEAVPSMLGGYSYAQEISSQKQLAAIKEISSSKFPKPELTQMIDESGIDFNRLVWSKPTTAGKIFGSATEYCLFTLDNFTVNQGSEIIGSAAVGGVFDNRGEKPIVQMGHGNGSGNGIGHSCTKSDLNFIVGDYVDGYFKGDIWGWLASGNLCDLSSDGTGKGVMTKTAFLDKDRSESYSEWYIYGDYVGPGEMAISKMLDSFFINARNDLMEASEMYRNPIAGTKGTVEIDSMAHLILTGSDPALNFFDVGVEQLNAARGININVPKDAYVQVNVTGSAKLEFKAETVRSSMMVSEDAKDPWGNPIKDVIINSYDNNYHKYGDSMEACRHLFWNMPDITEIVTKTPFAGSILAPKAHLQVDGVNVNGSIIVESATLNNSGGEFHNYPFDYENWPDGLPKTSVKVTKKWVGIPADKAEVELVANEVPTGQKVILNEQNNWTHTFADLPMYENGEPIKYTVAETDIPGYTASISGDAEKGFVITNTIVECSLKIKKQSTEDPKPLQGAEFKLYRETQDGKDFLEKLPGIKLTEVPGKFVTEAYGSITADHLIPGIYYLVETKAPDGYEILESPVRITLTQNTVVVERNNALIEGTSENSDVPTLTVKNKPGYRLPETGGTGTLYYSSGGILLMAVSLVCYVNRSRKSEKGVK